MPAAPIPDVEIHGFKHSDDVEEAHSALDDSAPKIPAKGNESDMTFRQQGYSISTDVRNMWFPIAISTEGDPIVIFRNKDGRPVVLADKCAHRSAALSNGQIVDGILECKYHGWQYNADGKVTHIPALLPDRKIPSNAKTYSYPVHEMDDLLWVWPGDPDKADPSLVPYMKPGNYCEQGKKYNEKKWGKGSLFVLDLDIDHSLMIENLLDPAHVAFTHNGTIGNRGGARSLNMHLVPSLNGIAGFGTTGTDEQKTGMNKEDPEFLFTAPCHIQLHSRFKEDWLFHQTIHCVPTRRGHMRIIYRESRTFFQLGYSIPFATEYMKNFSKKIIFQDYELLRGQQNRLRQGANEWNSPIQVDVLPRLYRQWWKASYGRRGAFDPWFKGYSGDIEDLLAPDAPYCSGCSSDLSDEPEPMFKVNPYVGYEENHPERMKARKHRRDLITKCVIATAGVAVASVILAKSGW
ncbi:hypothetical protein BC936DRAFT_137330 [Jimgerdemannia flammicorona]|uniref:Rieske domain-containing protein n=1 Tax=Jimgerdemannia flammicorona TaxID=994334 RepID=A0A433CXL0_9FUNG|nr:hypothetical protein BC936DRAFT_137330 [Jimgerdemannia flammicorona]